METYVNRKKVYGFCFKFFFLLYWISMIAYLHFGGEGVRGMVITSSATFEASGLWQRKEKYPPVDISNKFLYSVFTIAITISYVTLNCSRVVDKLTQT